MFCLCRSDALPAFLVEIDGLEVIGNVGILSHGDVAEVGLWSDCHNTAQVLAQLAAEPSVFALQGQSCLKPSFGHCSVPVPLEALPLCIL